MASANDTIAAVATPTGTGGIAVIRISGSEAEHVLERMFSARGPYEHGRMIYGRVLRDEQTVDRGYAVLFRGPKSYTGEDTAEVQVHGGSVTTSMVLEAAIAAGARPAQPGEFTRRAFLNGRIDLAQAQAVGDLIGALSEAGARLALRQTSEKLSAELRELSNSLKDILAHTEAVLEYPDEDIDPLDAQKDAASLRGVSVRLDELAGTVRAGRIIRDGLRVALAGAPNAGKSSLFNTLCGQNAAIVTDIPGTTRDCLRETIQVRGTAIHLSDTAGLRETENDIEREGVERAKAAAKESDLILFLMDSSAPVTDDDVEAWRSVQDLGVPIGCILSKTDLPRAVREADTTAFAEGAEAVVEVSTKSGKGIETITDILYERSCADRLLEETTLLSDLRQKDHLQRAAAAAQDAADILERGGMDADCACVDLRSACREIGSVTGEWTDEEIIDRIFSKFCLGK